MSKRSFFLSLAFAALASLAFAAPSQAGSTLVTTDVTFSVTGSATDVELTYMPAVDPISGLVITKTGGLSGLAISEPTANMVRVTFTGASATSGTLEFTFVTGTGTPPPIIVSNAALSGSIGSITGFSVVPTTTPIVPEPSSIALLGIGMTGFLAFRRFFKRAAVA